MNCKLFVALALVLFTATGYAQDRFFTKNARISFFSDAPLEDIEARTKQP